ncbi:hypothetical protein ASPCAL04353 [Aspergillus calidoustus]|uniref:Uncharacterized protein n=1 Tax=Aspergillus calidoustus TaxID=454130 RepID=A0A0U5C556_ASPCI|nr:hypothetical protein ASPCAL04353 [Aspergillus calidoustus]
MPLRWRKRPQRPPVPFVEDEVESLSRELNGSSHRGELPGIEGVKARGTVNQYPMILDVEILFPSKASSNVEEKSSSRNDLSGIKASRRAPKVDNQQDPKQNPLRHPAGESQSQEPGKPRSRSPTKPQDVRPRTQPPQPLQPTQHQIHVPHTNTYGPSQRPISRQPEPSHRAPVRMDMSPPKLVPDVALKSQSVPSRTTSMRQGREQQSGSPTRPRPEPTRDTAVRENVLLPRPVPQMIQKGQSLPSRTPSVRREREQKSSSPTRAEVVRDTDVRAESLPPKRMPDVAPKVLTLPSRTPSLRREKEQTAGSNARTHSEHARDINVRIETLPPRQVSNAAQKNSSPPSRPLPIPSEKQQRDPSTIPNQPEPVRDTDPRRPELSKRVPDATHRSQSVARPPVPSQEAGHRRTRSSTVSYQPEIVVRESGVRVDKIPARPLPDLPQTSQAPQYPPVPPRSAPPKASPAGASTDPVPEVPRRSQTVPLQSLPNPPAQGPRTSSTSTTKRQATTKYDPSNKPSPVELRPTSEYASDSATMRLSHGATSNDSPPTQVDSNLPPSPGLSIAERLEEKLKIRREQRDSAAGHEYPSPRNTSNSSGSRSPEKPIASTQPPGAWPADPPSDASSGTTPFPSLEASTGQTKPQESAPAPLKSALRSQSLDRDQPAPAQPARRRTVSFAEEPLEFPSQALVKVDHETALTQVQKQDMSPELSRSSSPNASLTLAPCPRSVPVAGYQDWHTIDGLTHLDICPSCVKQMRKTIFRDRIMLSAPKSRNEPIRCAMSEPWTRLAWMQTLKKKLDNLDLLDDITASPPGGKSCTGRIISDQYWYRIIDPDTGAYLPQFNVCSACVRNIRLLMPAHRETFERCTSSQERVCDFVVDSPRFIRYIDALDFAANRAEQEGKTPDLSEFLAYARRKVVLRDCRRSRLILNTWHYMPQLPEFTVCEDCYDDIVWPLCKARHPIAREFSTVPRLLPGDKSSSREASCQLYSPRIRAKFNDAVRRDDLQFIKWMALTRFDAEQRFRDRQDELLEDQDRGYDRSGDLRKNLEDWKRYE